MAGLSVLGVIGLFAAAVIGWCWNIYKVIVAFQAAATITALAPFDIFRLVGIILAPLGSILGYF